MLGEVFFLQFQYIYNSEVFEISAKERVVAHIDADRFLDVYLSGLASERVTVLARLFFTFPMRSGEEVSHCCDSIGFHKGIRYALALAEEEN